MCGNKVMLGDGAYPLLEFLLTPFRDNHHLTHKMTRYNVVHGATRSRIEQAFGLLKGELFQNLRNFSLASDLTASI